MQPKRRARGPDLRAFVPILVALLLAVPRPAPAQEVLPALIGGAIGLAGGGYVSVGIVTLKARRGDYVYSAREVLGWESSPVLIGGSVGFILGLTDRDRLQRSVIGAALAGFVGTGIGMTVGVNRWNPPEGRWAGGVIGGAAGILLGATVGALLPGKGGGSEDGLGGEGIPLGVRIRF